MDLRRLGRTRGELGVAAMLACACGDDGGAAATSTATGPASSTATDEPTTVSPPGSTGDAPSTGAPGGSSGDDGTADTTAGSAAACDPSWLVCEDFESAAIGANPDGWALRPSGVYGGNGMGVSDEQAVSGTRAFRLAGGESGAQWLTYQGDITAFTDGHWGRMYFRMGAPVPWPGGGVIHGDLFEARGRWNDSTHQVRWAVINNPAMQHNWGYNVQTSNAGEFIHETGYVYPWTEDWLCVEWHHDRIDQHATLWVDGAPLLDVVSTDDPQIPVFDDISVGWANYQPASPEFVVFIDDVVLDDERIGCGD